MSMVALFLSLCLLLTSCDLFPTKQAAGSSSVGENGADLTVDGVRIQVPAGAAPVGTKVEASFEDRDPTGATDASFKTLAKAFKIKLGDGLQPSKPLTITVPVDRSRLVSERPNDTPTTLALMVQSEGSSAPDLVRAVWNPGAGTLTAQVPHLSFVWPVQLDLKALMNKVRDAVLQSLGIEYPKPDCEGKTATVSGTTYSAISQAQAWICVSAIDGNLTVDATPNSPLPFLVSSTPASTARNVTEVSASTAFTVALGRNLGFTKGSQAFMLPGADARFTFTAPAGDVKLRFRQYPAMLLVSILAKTLDVALKPLGKAVQLDKIDDLDCLQNVFGTSQTGTLSSSQTAGVVKSFFVCAGSVLELTLAQEVVMAILGSGPQLLVASATGVVNEFTGLGDFTATITATGPKPSATRFVTLDPWHDGSLSAVTETLEAPGQSSCTGSEIAPRKDGFRCFIGNGVHDPCFRGTEAPADFLCSTVGATGTVTVTRIKNIGTSSITGSNSGVSPNDSSPVRIELTDGTVCGRATGAGPQGVPGYPYWSGICFGPSAGIWRVGEADQWKDDLQHYQLYPALSEGGYLQAAVSVGSETAPARLLNVKTVYR
ncbi:hypothetical protein [Arthrobacter globiformis]|uniref:hypothetical protein n=1 Tax=Arthrobacter globiformis TaxID=1665 RepID=UPI0027D8A619|nr:hypothetical protein [Arthrobacter globiformis]